MTPSQIAAKAVDLSKALRAMSPEPVDAIAVLIGALGMVTGKVEGVSVDDAWNEVTSGDHKELFRVYFEQARSK